jgi:hypothetical protein
MFLDAGLMFVDHHTVDQSGLPGAVKIQMDASAWFNQVVIDLFAGFVHVPDCLIEHASKGIIPAFRTHYYYFAWLIRGGYCA